MGMLGFDVQGFWGVWDGKTGDSPAFSSTICAVPPPYRSTPFISLGPHPFQTDLGINRGVHVIGAYRMGSVLAFAAGKSMRLNSQGVRTTNPPSTVKRLYIRCEKLPVGDWQPKHPYSAGDLVYGTLSYGSQRNGFHYQCV